MKYKPSARRGGAIIFLFRISMNWNTLIKYTCSGLQAIFQPENSIRQMKYPEF